MKSDLLLSLCLFYCDFMYQIDVLPEASYSEGDATASIGAWMIKYVL